MPTTALVTCKLVHALCASAKLSGAGTQGAKASGEWRKEFEALWRSSRRLAAAAAALQLKSDKKVRADDPEVLELTLDLLADRYS
ncbi:hypothetical protein Q5P01_001018 [Channa striata]|uniref:Uncharacterized protein n=1 Tax=Channa striata TaxID=64152 RepID=A0AA88LFZ8_CHASR|nr:hypothetical protein Q5P01_001018 [Channa striata]